MRMQSRVVIAALVLASAARVVDGQDTVTLKDGSSKQGNIQEIDFRGVRLAVSGGGGTTTIKDQDVVSITFGAIPKEMKQGDDEFARGKWDEAIASYATVIENKKNRSVFRQEAWLNTGLAHLKAGRVDDSIKALKAMISDAEFPQSRYLGTVNERLAALQVASGKGSDGVTFLEAEESRIQKLPESGALVDRIKLLKAEAALGAGDTKKAKSEATLIAGGSSPLAGDAKVLMAQIALAERNVPEATKLFTDAMKTVATKRARAACFNGLGSILLEQGKEKKTADQIREALLLFLRTALVLVPDAGEPTDAHETGIYRAAESFQYLGELSAAAPSKADTKAAEAKPDDAQNRHLSRARELFRRLLREYPQSKHAAEAQSRLTKLGG